MDIQRTITSLTSYLENCFEQPSMQQQHLSGTGATYLLEDKLRCYYNKRFALSFNNATTALQAVCISLELHNTELLTTPINWGGSISPFLLNNVKLRFAAFDENTLNLSPCGLPDAFTPKTKAVLSTDYNGTPADSKSIKEFCLQQNLYYISDSAQSLGSSLNNKPAGYFADAIILSFSPSKSFFAGEGGAVITNDEVLFNKLLLISQHPSKQKAVLGISNYNEYAPLNGRMNPLSAILLNETFDESFSILHKYQTKCYQLLEQLQKQQLAKPTPHILAPASSSFFNFSLQHESSVKIEQINDFLNTQGSQFAAINTLPMLIPFDTSFRKHFRGKFSCAENLLKQKKGGQFKNYYRLIFSP